MSGGVIGNTTVFGSVISGSSPGRITHGDYSLMGGRKLVALHVRVRFSLVTPHCAKQKIRAEQKIFPEKKYKN